MFDSLAEAAARNPEAGDLQYVRGGSRFNPGANVAPNDLGDPNELENSEDCRSAGGHGNQHVRLRDAQIDASDDLPGSRSALLLEPWQTRPVSHHSKARHSNLLRV